MLDLIEGDRSSWKSDVLSQLAAASQLSAYHQPGIWQSMYTLCDQTRLEELWASGQAPWKLW